MAQLTILFPGSPVTCALYPDWIVFVYQGMRGEDAVIVMGGSGVAHVPPETLKPAKLNK